MDTTHVIVKWINRIVLSIFLILILLGFSNDEEIFIYAIFFTILIGISQFLSALVLSFKNYKEQIKKRIRIYIFTTILYLVSGFLMTIFFDDLFNKVEDILIYIAISIPVLLLIYFTYLAETITNNSLKK